MKTCKLNKKNFEFDNLNNKLKIFKSYSIANCNAIRVSSNCIIDLDYLDSEISLMVTRGVSSVQLKNALARNFYISFIRKDIRKKEFKIKANSCNICCLDKFFLETDYGCSVFGNRVGKGEYLVDKGNVYPKELWEIKDIIE